MKTGTKIRKRISEISIGLVIGFNIIYDINNPGDDKIILSIFLSICIIGFLMILWVGDPAMDDLMDD